MVDGRFQRYPRRIRLPRSRPLRSGRYPLTMARHQIRSKQMSWRQISERDQTGDTQWTQNDSQLASNCPLQRRDRARNRQSCRRRHPRNAPSNAATALAAAASPATSNAARSAREATSNAARSARDNRVPNASPALTFASTFVLRRIPPPTCPFGSNCCCCCSFAICQIERKVALTV